MSLLESVDRELNPFPVYAEMRATHPVYFDQNTRHWNVFRFEDVQRVLSEYESFSSQFAGDPDDPNGMFGASMISSDPPRHRELRSLVTKAFTPKAIEALAPRIKTIVDEYLDKVRGQGHMDVIRDLGYPLPVIVIAELMGIPAQDREKFKHWSDQIVQLGNAAGEFDYKAFQTHGGAIMEMGQYFMGLINERQQDPQDDLITGLLQAEVDGQHLDMIELLGFCSLLLVAGNETTTNLIGNAMLTFSERPEVWQRLREDPDLVPQAIEEVLRFRSPVQSMYRVAKEGAQIGGQALRPGERMLAWIGSANRDENQFERADDYDLERTPNRHLAFGQGIHYCLGAPLARLEARIALTEMAERFSEISLQPGANLERLPTTLIYGLKQVPIRFQEGSANQDRWTGKNPSKWG